jgi:hypothetical protein
MYFVAPPSLSLCLSTRSNNASLMGGRGGGGAGEDLNDTTESVITIQNSVLQDGLLCSDERFRS